MRPSISGGHSVDDRHQSRLDESLIGCNQTKAVAAMTRSAGSLSGRRYGTSRAISQVAGSIRNESSEAKSPKNSSTEPPNPSLPPSESNATSKRLIRLKARGSPRPIASAAFRDSSPACSISLRQAKHLALNSVALSTFAFMSAETWSCDQNAGLGREGPTVPFPHGWLPAIPLNSRPPLVRTHSC